MPCDSETEPPGVWDTVTPSCPSQTLLLHGGSLLLASHPDDSNRFTEDLILEFCCLGAQWDFS
jgi:hypothetical protein